MIKSIHYLILTPLILLFFSNSEKLSAQAADGCHQFRTQTPGGWGSNAAGNNPGSYRDANFAEAFPEGISLGCLYTLRFTSSDAVRIFLPSGSTPRPLEESLVNPVTYSNVLAGHLLALTLSVGFDAHDPGFSPSQSMLSNQIVASGTFAGFTVSEIMEEANNILGGCISDYSPSQITMALASINENYVDGVQNGGFLLCPEEEPLCSINIESIAAECTDNEQYSVTIGISGSNGSFEVFSPNAISGNGTLLCFGNTDSPEFPSFTTVELVFAQGEDYTFYIDGAINPDCDADNAGNGCSIAQIEGVSPNCCSLNIQCFDPGETNFSCPTEFPEANPDALSYSDNCGEVNISVSESTQGSGCGGNPLQLIRTYTITDGSNVQTCTHIFQAEDTEPPVITCPEAEYAYCSDEIVPGVFATATDNCSSDVYISYTNGTASDCGSFVRTWIAVDECGNTAYCDQTIYIEDNTPPVLNLPQDATIACGASTSTLYLGRAYATDLCSYVTLTYQDGVIEGEGCTTTFARTWIAVDACGNESTGVQTITQVDVTGPVISGVQPSSTIQCGEAPPPAEATATDQCSGNTVPVTFDETINVNGCRTTISRAYTATDECGNTTTRYQNITIEDTEGPQMTCPADVLLACDDDAYTPDDIGVASANDNCSGALVTISYQDSERNNNTCPPTIQRIWTAIDTCGNVSNCIQKIMFDDQDAPEISCVDNITINCAEASILPEDTGTPGATDACSDVAITYQDGPIQGDCPVSFVRTWKAMDACANASYCYQTITVIDEIAPEIICPADITISCAYSNALPSRTGFASATDQCLSVYLTYEDGPVTGECPKVFTRSWIATDYCGNTSSCDQVISLEDNMLPLVTCPADAVVSCEGDISPEALGVATAIDFCSTVAVSYEDVEVEGACPSAISRIWTATDACGNSRSCSQNILFENGDLPSIVCPADITVGCTDDVDPEFTGTPLTSASCSTLSVTYNDSIAAEVGSGGGTNEGCGSLRTQTQGGWGSTANGNNPGAYRDAHFEGAFPNGLVVGCDFTLTLTSSAAVQDFLPSGGPVRLLTANLEDPSDYQSVLAGQLVAATLSIGFDVHDTNFGESEVLLGDMIISTGTFAGWTVNEVVEEANLKIGGCQSAYGGSELVQVLTSINESYVDGSQHSEFLDCPDTEGTENDDCGTIYRTWSATDDCGNTVECIQQINRTVDGSLIEMSESDQDLIAYPSPTNDVVFLSSTKAASISGTIDVMTINGIIVLSKSVSGDLDRLTLSLGSLETGFYIIRWINGDSVRSVPVFKN